MTFWNTSDGKQVEQTSSFESGGGNFEPIPNNTKVLAVAEDAKWVGGREEYGNKDHISIRWSVLQPEQYKNRKVFHKIHVMDDDTAKADRSKRMLAAIDANAGGKLMKIGREPEDHELISCLANKPMVLNLQVWKMGEGSDERTGNWVSAVSARKGAAPVAEPAPAPEVATPSPGFEIDNSDIPF